jgi:hypothetical protein
MGVVNAQRAERRTVNSQKYGAGHISGWLAERVTVTHPCYVSPILWSRMRLSLRFLECPGGAESTMY